MENVYTLELYHHGVKGMRWGVRRKEKKLTKLRKRADRENWSDDAKSTIEIKSKKRDQLSNSELKKVNERLRLENEYSRLMGERKKKSPGRKAVEEVLAGAAKDTAKSYVSKYMKKGIDLGAKMVMESMINKK